MEQFYRNQIEVQGIEPGFLWQLTDGKMVLVDDDQYIESDFDPTIFIPEKLY